MKLPQMILLKLFLGSTAITILSSCGGCPVKSVTLAPSVNYDAIRPTSVTAAGSVKVEFGEYCPSKAEREIIDNNRKLSDTLLSKFIADEITETVYNTKRNAIQNHIEHIVSQGKGLANKQPVPTQVAKAITSAPAKIVTGITKTVANTVNVGTKNQTVITPAADPNATVEKKAKAVADAKKNAE